MITEEEMEMFLDGIIEPLYIREPASEEKERNK